MKETNVIINLQIEGIHNWPKAKDILPDVAFLSDLHRHIFHICAKKKVYHNDRDVEIIMLKREIELYLKQKFGSPCMFQNLSCEMIANLLFKEFGLIYCSVLEDNENGAEVVYHPHVEAPVYGADDGVSYS